jgi:hypothetical protein
MTGKKEAGIKWRQTPVFVRADIFEEAHKQGIDIHDVCNRALADKLGIDYRQQQIGDVTLPAPVIIAQTSTPADTKRNAQKGSSTRLPVINADDPAAMVKVMKAQQTGVKPSREIPLPKPTRPDEKNTVTPPAKIPLSSPGKGKKGDQEKKRKGDALKKFVSQKVAREDADNALITKDDLYHLFTRWCNDHRITPVPDRKVVTVSLKNQCAFREKMVDGIPCWVNVRLK